MMRDMKPLPDRDPARAKLAAAIALEAGAARDLQVAEQAAGLAASRYFEAEDKLEAMRKAAAVPHVGLADDFIASVASGAPCDAAVLGKSAVEARAKMTAAESEVNVWKQTHEECDLAVRAKEAEVVTAKERVEKAARHVVATSAEGLLAGLEEMQAEVIERRVALRFVWGKGLNGELSQPDKERIENLLRQDLTGLESHPVYGVWRAAFEELQSNPEAELPS
jgi:hypothetical protein